MFDATNITARRFVSAGNLTLNKNIQEYFQPTYLLILTERSNFNNLTTSGRAN